MSKVQNNKFKKLLKRLIVFLGLSLILLIGIHALLFNPFIYKKIVIYQLGLSHDTFLDLSVISSESDIEPLLLCLKMDGEIEEGEPIICTGGHLIEALEHATKTKYGYSFKAWNDWFVKKYSRNINENICISGNKNNTVHSISYAIYEYHYFFKLFLYYWKNILAENKNESHK